MKDKNTEGFLGALLELDKKISLSLSLSASKKSPLGKYRSHMKALEYSCHGVFWICGSMIMLWLFEDPLKEAFFLNILIAMLIDILFVAILKAILRRKRPDINEKDDMFLTLSVDKMSCPSGHTSRAILITFLLMFCTPDMPLLHVFLLLWCICTCASRVLLGRHYVGDILVGAILGFVEYWIMKFVWMGPEKAEWYLYIFGDNSLVDDL